MTYTTQGFCSRCLRTRGSCVRPRDARVFVSTAAEQQSCQIFREFRVEGLGFRVIMELGPKAPCMIIVSGLIADLHDTGSSGDLEGPSGLVGPI